ncbi:hypothetical protein QQF64_035886 [Cirrhinus molitorella]|uniref:Uncharacterized protein n=1 Tax=Cirrhinus molitorella TaxID=172907 RepID=A0ABR3NHU1_9TELE
MTTLSSADGIKCIRLKELPVVLKCMLCTCSAGEALLQFNGIQDGTFATIMHQLIADLAPANDTGYNFKFQFIFEPSYKQYCHLESLQVSRHISGASCGPKYGNQQCGIIIHPDEDVSQVRPLITVRGQACLKKSHKYYYQVQGQLALSGLQWCDFILDTHT